MNKRFNLDKFIAQHVTRREKSLTYYDLIANEPWLRSRIAGKNTLVIGGAGSIGSQFIKALLRYEPASLVVVDSSENGLTELTRDLRSSHQQYIPEQYLTYPTHFQAPVFRKIWKNEGPFHIVANFAAHKHVRSEKDQYAIEAMLENNVLHARYLLDLLCENPPERFFCVSTDKAANPANVMGASKKLMENLLLAYSDILPVTTARFANVAFSNGSLLDGFLQRIAKKQPLSAPKHIRRYFVSPQEAGEICLLAAIIGQSGQIFFPKLSTQDLNTFTDIAKSLLHQLGYAIDLCDSETIAREKAARYLPDAKYYPVYFFEPDTSGEKPEEEFYTPEEKVNLDDFQALGYITPQAPLSRERMYTYLHDLQQLLARPDTGKADIVAAMENMVPGFRHLETGKNLDQRM